MKASAALAWFVLQYPQSQSSSLLWARALLASPAGRSSRRAPPLLASSSSFLGHRRHTTNRVRRNMSSSAADAAVDEIDVAEHLRQVRAALAAAQLESPDPTTNVRLVAVSKTKPLALLVKAYEEGDCRIFGENYVQELAEKVPAMPADAHWHFIGSLQSNKVNLLLQAFVPDDVHRLTLETVATAKLARKLNQAVLAQAVPGAQLCVFVQVNTSGEDSKSGVTPGDDVTELCRVIRDDCPALQLQGLMTIGAAGDEACLQALVDCRTAVAAALELPLASELELSMGMSGDYEAAIRYGATNVRVGSTIFGARNYANT